ncbi:MULTISPECIES: hypothetical protein [unclassified Bradyrhizobium]|uniref:hypothetical protein n=1 Tax=unclassified Bradyrhizobium TaxID=2631580 RepID=UPI0028E8C95D|nr:MULTISPECIES: hypothetical protein [unclassified Bradyrhizobium]
MTKIILVSVALIAAAGFATQAQAARSNNAAAHRAMSKSRAVTDCVRAPKAGAFASDPYTESPCMPNTMN